MVDIGFGTLDIFSIEDSVINPNETAGYELGAHFAVREAQSQIFDKTGVSTTEKQSAAFLRRSAKVLRYAKGEYDVSAIVDASIDIWLTKIEAKLPEFPPFYSMPIFFFKKHSKIHI